MVIANKSLLTGLIALVAFSALANAAPLPSNDLEEINATTYPTLREGWNYPDLQSRAPAKNKGKGKDTTAPASTQPTTTGIDNNTPDGSIAPGSKNAVKNFVNPSNNKDEKKLNSGIQDQLDTPSSTGKTIYQDKGTGLRLDNQGPNAANGVKANFQVQQNAKSGKSTCASCIVHEGANPTPDDVKNGLATSAAEEKNFHIFRKRQILLALTNSA